MIDEADDVSLSVPAESPDDDSRVCSDMAREGPQSRVVSDGDGRAVRIGRTVRAFRAVDVVSCFHGALLSSLSLIFSFDRMVERKR